MIIFDVGRQILLKIVLVNELEYVHDHASAQQPRPRMRMHVPNPPQTPCAKRSTSLVPFCSTSFPRSGSSLVSGILLTQTSWNVGLPDGFSCLYDFELKVGSVDGSIGSKWQCLVYTKKPVVLAKADTPVACRSHEILEGMIMTVETRQDQLGNLLVANFSIESVLVVVDLRCVSCIDKACS